ncbi:MAG: hypothetical protein QXK37_01305 [Candidatus Woesearchaeota archaeon]
MKKIEIGDIEDPDTRKFLRDLSEIQGTPEIDVYTCSDARMSAVRQILSQMGNVNIISTAGNIVESPNPRLSIIIGHGISSLDKGCGAVDYKKSLEKELGRGATHGNSDGFPGLKKNVLPGIKDNAHAQLERVPEKFRAGVFYFEQDTGRIRSEPSNSKYAMYKEGTALFERVERSLKGYFSNDELEAMKRGQDPKIIMVTNFNVAQTAEPVFRVNVQSEITQVVMDSLHYAVSHALGEGSFRSSRSTIIALKGGLPERLEEFLSGSKILKEYVHGNNGREKGSLYLVELRGNEKTVYKAV